MIPVIFLWAITGPVLKWMGNEEVISNMAWYYAAVLISVLPSRIILANLGSFFKLKTFPIRQYIALISESY